MKKLILLSVLILNACTGESDLDDFVGKWKPVNPLNKYEEVEIEKADDNELRMILHNQRNNLNFIMIPEDDHKIKSKEAMFGSHIIWKYDEEKGLLIDYNLNQEYQPIK
ncbi:hypothetical protein Oweho_0253 [Owenweeksia hongkongensis DSM 17368]|uniref:Uncharacterized protein n=1 Tax=Owenweeksia hongkongensis (strain DSM 17368 / CIP 108786 / JCM 12287 / NRRL B-23963 / UST20020801) TaxID=926562 RepID=G8R7G4_OWEHD|nr:MULTISPECIES: hypothetical protein [Bacteroidota]AEV31275.1 hypothetical protein Oweho_0253 [Owenweeksia hongkongensis DSM 17368]MBI0400591.1 hypothetical protein [Cyclobacterium marinum]